MPTQLITQLAASLQSISSVQELSPHDTTQGTSAGQVMGAVQSALTQLNVHAPDSQTPPTSVHDAPHACASAGESGGASPVSTGASRLASVGVVGGL